MPKNTIHAEAQIFRWQWFRGETVRRKGAGVGENEMHMAMGTWPGLGR